jgi:hypothetical protein
LVSLIRIFCTLPEYHFSFLFFFYVTPASVEISTFQIPSLLSLSLSLSLTHAHTQTHTNTGNLQDKKSSNQNGCFTEAHRRRTLPLLSRDRTRSAADRRADVSSSQIVPASGRRTQELVLPRVR